MESCARAKKAGLGSSMLELFKAFFLPQHRHISLRFKFILVMTLCLFITMTISTWYLGKVQAKAFEQEARHRSEIVATFGEANRKFVSKNLRPTVEKYTKDFVLEAMSATFSTRTVFKYFNENLPEYLYRQPTLNPLNRDDQADEFDRQIIQRFQNDRTLKEITGYRIFNHKENFYIAKPIQVESSCLKCHWTPETAPAALVKKYGSMNGYGWKVGDIISTLMIHVPTQDLRVNQVALTHTVFLTFAGLAVILIGLISVFFDQLVNQRLRNMIQVMEQVSAMPSLNTQLSDRSGDELGLLAHTFNRMANSLEFAYSNLEQKVAERTVELKQTLQQLQQTQMQMVQAEKMSSLGQLVAGIAHEINNPVNFISGNLTYVNQYTQNLLRLLNAYQQNYPNPPQSLQADLEDVDLDFLTEDLTKILQSMKVGSNRIREIVLSLRNFSRLDEAEFKSVNLHEGIDNTLMILQHRLKANTERPAIEVVKQYGDLPLVECFVGQLNQVFMNLLANAIDALEESNRDRSFQDMIANPNTIWISTVNQTPTQVQITIADNGCGIPENVRSRLFDPFFTTKPVGKGTGLGLSISYQVVTEKHGGKLWYDFTLGTGTKFVIELPISGGRCCKG